MERLTYEFMRTSFSYTEKNVVIIVLSNVISIVVVVVVIVLSAVAPVVVTKSIVHDVVSPELA